MTTDLKFKSPVGRYKLLQKSTLEEGLVAYHCPETSGVYITLQDYWTWLQKQPARLKHLPSFELASTVVEIDSKAKLCPETGTIMMRCKVGNGFDFYIDRSKTGGIWLDAGEWDALKSRQFHDELHLIFTEPWQQKIRDWEEAQLNQKLLNEKLGKELLAELDQFKDVLSNHPHKAYAIAYLEHSG